MAQEKKACTFIIVPGNASKTYSLRLHHGLLYLLGAACLLIFGFFVYVMAVHQRVLSEAQRAERLEMENGILRAQMQKVAHLERELTRLQNIRQHLCEIAGLPAEPSQNRSEGSIAKGINSLLTEDVYRPTSEVSPASEKMLTTVDTLQAGAPNVPTLWPVRGWVTAEFNELLPGREKRHMGVDIAGSQGTPILSAASGEVTFSGWDKDLGLVVVLDHKNGLSTLYGHCSRVTVEVGNFVVQGQIIALLGNTGKSSAPHLHFEIREDGVPVDPRGYLGP